MVDEKSILDLRNGIAEEFQPERIILFGSYAPGVVRADSDLDILIVFRNAGRTTFQLDCLTPYQNLKGNGKPFSAELI